MTDGKPVKFLAAPGQTAVFLARTIRASSRCTLTVGIGGGDRLDVWLNGRKIASAATHLISGRYGCSDQFDGTRVDQLLVDLDLQAGENTLRDPVDAGRRTFVLLLGVAESRAAALGTDPPGLPGRAEPAVGPGPRRLVRHAGLVRRPRHGVRGTTDRAPGRRLRQRRALRSARNSIGSSKPQADRDDRRWLDLCVKASVLATLGRDLARLRAAVSELGRSHAGRSTRPPSCSAAWTTTSGG